MVSFKIVDKENNKALIDALRDLGVPFSAFTNDKADAKNCILFLSNEKEEILIEKGVRFKVEENDPAETLKARNELRIERDAITSTLSSAPFMQELRVNGLSLAITSIPTSKKYDSPSTRVNTVKLEELSKARGKVAAKAAAMFGKERQEKREEAAKKQEAVRPIAGAAATAGRQIQQERFEKEQQMQQERLEKEKQSRFRDLMLLKVDTSNFFEKEAELYVENAITLINNGYRTKANNSKAIPKESKSPNLDEKLGVNIIGQEVVVVNRSKPNDFPFDALVEELKITQQIFLKRIREDAPENKAAMLKAYKEYVSGLIAEKLAEKTQDPKEKGKISADAVNKIVDSMTPKTVIRKLSNSKLFSVLDSAATERKAEVKATAHKVLVSDCFDYSQLIQAEVKRKITSKETTTAATFGKNVSKKVTDEQRPGLRK